MATIQDIAMAVGVAKSTVSRALREDTTLSIKEETKAKIFETAQQMGYKVKREKLLSGARSVVVVHKDTHFLNQIDNAYYFSIRYGIEQECLKRGIQCSFMPYGFFKQLPAYINGAIALGSFHEEEVKNMIEATHNVPLSFIGKMNHTPHLTDWITYDVKGSVDVAMDYLAHLGFSRVLYVGGEDTEGTPPEYQKVFYFRRFLEEHPEFECLGVLEGQHGAESGYQMMKKWIEKNEELPQVVFASYDPIAFGVLRALTEKEIAVPGEVSVISMNGDGPGESTAPPLTTVDIHAEEMGREAVRCLEERLNKERMLTKKVVYPPSLIERSSVKSLKVAD